VKVLALDFGSARTGVAVSDPTGEVARPLGVVERAATQTGVGRILELARQEEADAIVVGLPVTLRGDLGLQAAETERFVELLRAATDLPVETFDERFTTKLARQTGRGRAKRPPVERDALAAAHLLSSYLIWKSARPA
jgi:putative holliday junction resolvase